MRSPSALYGREQSGEGTYIDVSMLGGQIALLTYHATSYFSTGKIPTAQGNAHAIIVPYDMFPTGDGFVNIAVGNDRLWQKFCEALEMPDAAANPDFATNADRNANKAGGVRGDAKQPWLAIRPQRSSSCSTRPASRAARSTTWRTFSPIPSRCTPV